MIWGLKLQEGMEKFDEYINGVPFSLEIPSTLTTRDALSKEKFDTIMQTGLAQAKADDSLAMDDAFNQLKAEI